MYTPQVNCRACGFGPSILPPGLKRAEHPEALERVFSLGVQPLANDFCERTQERAGFAPLEVLLCPRCGLAQLSVVVKPEVLYRHYLYVTSPSVMMHDHFRRLWADCSKLAKSKTVLEIGSNDGAFLAHCLESGAESVIGIEPAENLAEIARNKGIQTVCDFFGPEAAECARQAMPKVGLVFARHVFCHVANWQGFFAAMQVIADEDTLICIEVPYVMDLLEQNQFDTIYHEHLSYLSIRAMRALLDGTPFHMRAVLHYPIHGGAILLMIQRRGANSQPDPSLARYLEAEEPTVEMWKAFGQEVGDNIDQLRSYIYSLRSSGKKVAGYGASAKSTVWINACGFDRNDLAFVVDATPQKQYRLIPGTDIPIFEPEALESELPDYVVCFAWNFIAEILAKEQAVRKRGVKFIVPVPRIKVIGLDNEGVAE